MWDDTRMGFISVFSECISYFFLNQIHTKIMKCNLISKYRFTTIWWVKHYFVSNSPHFRESLNTLLMYKLFLSLFGSSFKYVMEIDTKLGCTKKQNAFIDRRPHSLNSCLPSRCAKLSS